MAAPVAQLVTDDSGRILLANHRAVTLFALEATATNASPDTPHERGHLNDHITAASQTALKSFFRQLSSRTHDSASYRLDLSHGGAVRIEGVVLDDTHEYLIAATDITAHLDERRRTEERLALIERLLAHAPGIVFQLRIDPDQSFHLPYVSDSVSGMLGLSELAVDPSPDLFASHMQSDDATTVLSAMFEAARTLTAWKHEYRVFQADGSQRWRALTALPERLADGTVLWYGHAIDITERKQMEEELRLNEERWKLALEGAGHGVWDSDRVTGITLFSRRWKELLGYSEDEISNHAEEWMSRVHPDDMPLIAESQRQVISGERESRSVEFRVRCKDGQWKWMLGSGILVSRNAQGEPLRLVGTLSDINERKKLEETLREREELWKFAIEGAGDGVWDWHVAKGEISFSARWDELLGYPAVGKTHRYDDWVARIHPDDMARSMANRARLMNRSIDHIATELRFRCHDGRWKWVLSRGMVVSYDAEGRPLRLVGTLSDIDIRKQTEEALRLTLLELDERRREAEHHAQAKMNFLNAASHDLRQPLYAAQLFAEGLGNEPLSPQQQATLSHLQTAIRAMSAQLQMLLDISRLDMGRIEPQLHMLAVTDLYHGLTATYAPIAAQAGVTLRFLPGHAVIHTDSLLLGRLLGNLIDNAIKFAGNGHVVVCSRRCRQGWRIEVRDNGPGIDAEHLPRICEEYYQINNPARDQSAGLGLGLSIVQRIARLLGASLDIRSRPGQGAVFSVTLPVAHATQPPSSKAH
jgi:PAS domain S-box-containing protein